MKRRILVFHLIFVLVFSTLSFAPGMPATAWADTPGSAGTVSVTTEQGLRDTVTDAVYDNYTISIDQDIKLTSALSIKQNVVLTSTDGHTVDASDISAIDIYPSSEVILNGKLKVTGNANPVILVYQNGGSLTLTENAIVEQTEPSQPAIRNIGGTINVTGGTVNSSGGGIANNSGTLIVTGGTVNGKNNAIDVTGGTLTVNGGTIGSTTNSTYGIYVSNVGTAANIDGGDIQGSYIAMCIDSGATVNMTGGTVEGESFAVNNIGGTLTVNGGTIGNTSDNTYGITVTAGTVNINGGNISGKSTAVSVSDAGTLSISGGTFTPGEDTAYALRCEGTATLTGGSFTTGYMLTYGNGKIHIDLSGQGNSVILPASGVFYNDGVPPKNFLTALPTIPPNVTEGQQSTVSLTGAYNGVVFAVDSSTSPELGATATGTPSTGSGSTAVANMTPTAAGDYNLVLTAAGTGSASTQSLKLTLPVTVSSTAANVCEIVGGEQYAKLDVALNAVPTGGATATTIKLLQDINYTGGMMVNNKKITFDLNGKTLLVDNDNATMGAGLYVTGGSVIDIINPGAFNVTGSYMGLKAQNSNVKVTKVNADELHGIIAENNSGITVTNDVTSALSMAAVASSGSRINIGGNVSGADYGVYAQDTGTTITVAGNVSATGANSFGVHSRGGAAVTVHGNVTATGNINSIGAKIGADGTLTVDGTIIAPKYIMLELVEKTAADKTTPTTKPGYNTYTGSTSIVWVAMTDAEKVAADKAILIFDSIKGMNDAKNNITVDLAALPAAGDNGSTINWSSSDPSTVSSSGSVTRPVNGTGDKAVTLTATITSGAASDTVVFSLTVKEMTQTAGPFSPTLAAGSNHSLYLKEDGTVWSWGSNDSGQLGRGTVGSDIRTADQIPGLTDVKAIDAGELFSVALKNDGTVWAWGLRGNARLGEQNPPTNYSLTPLKVEGITDIQAISAGAKFNLALDKDGNVWAWGDNEYNQLGRPYVAGTAHLPEKISGLSDIVAISAGAEHALALDKNGAVWSWGGNGSGELGQGSTSYSGATPQAVTGLSGIKVERINAGFQTSMLITDTGAVYGWGYNYYGQLGGGNRSNYPKVPVLTSYSDITALRNQGKFSIALKSDDTLWAVGSNEYGSLGIGSTAVGTDDYNSVVTQVKNSDGSGYLSGIVALSGGNGGSHTLALDRSGKVWAWGYNSRGQLGDNSQTDRNLPVQVQFPVTKEPTPSATFTATDFDSGSLANLKRDTRYSVDGGTTWLLTTGSMMNIYGVTAANSIKVKKLGNGTTTTDSDIQTITVTQAAVPTGLSKVNCTTTAQNDGKLIGLTAAMEYKRSNDVNWISGTGGDITGLASGTYYVRVKAAGTVLASEDAELVIAPYGLKLIPVPTANSGLKWTGSEQIGVNGGTGYTLGGAYKATDVSDYNATATLQAGYAWDDGTTVVKNILWSIGKANGPAAPTGLAGVAPTTAGGSNGKITGTTTAMEYADNTGFVNSADCFANETTGLAAGTYYVRVKATVNHEAGAYATITLQPAPSTYAVTVVNGTGSGSYAQGATVSVTANAAPSGQTFDSGHQATALPLQMQTAHAPPSQCQVRT